MPVHLSEKSSHISWCLVWRTSMFRVPKGNVASNNKDCLPFISSVICTAFTHIVEQEQLTVRQTERTQMTVVLMVHLFAGWRSWFCNHKLSTFSPATHKQKIILGYMFTLFKSHLLRKRVDIFGISRTPPRKSVGQSQIPRTAPSHNGARKRKKILPRKKLGKKLHGKKLYEKK